MSEKHTSSSKENKNIGVLSEFADFSASGNEGIRKRLTCKHDAKCISEEEDNHLCRLSCTSNKKDGHSSYTGDLIISNPNALNKYEANANCSAGVDVKEIVNDEGNIDIIADDEDITYQCYRQAAKIGHKVIQAGWDVLHHHHLPAWLQDNEFLLRGHRPELNNAMACFKSVFRLHTETGNIWTHLIGCVAFVAIMTFFITRPSIEIQWQEKAIFTTFFAAAIVCLLFSTLFHTLCCHSPRVSKLFSKLDYCGIAVLTVGSFVPWLYYSFYCSLFPKLFYLFVTIVLGSLSLGVGLWDKFSEPQYRTTRAAMFVGLGLSGVIPAVHYVLITGFWTAVNSASLGWLILMGCLYILGAFIYALRFPEKWFPGTFDIWFQSHQIFHVFVIAGAFVHYHGISQLANYRLSLGGCDEHPYLP